MRKILILSNAHHSKLGGTEFFNKNLIEAIKNHYEIFEFVLAFIVSLKQNPSTSKNNNFDNVFMFDSSKSVIIPYDENWQQKPNLKINKIYKLIQKLSLQKLALFAFNISIGKIYRKKNTKLLNDFIIKNKIDKIVLDCSVDELYKINSRKINKNVEKIAILHYTILTIDKNYKGVIKNNNLTYEKKYFSKHKNDFSHFEKVIISNKIDYQYFNEQFLKNKSYCLNWAIYNKAEILQNIQYIENKKDIIFVGRLDQRLKNLRALKEIASKINYPIHVYGTGPDEKILANATNIILHGNKTRDELKEIYKKAKLLVLTSNYEGFCYVIGEALSFGIPVICFDTFNSCHETLANDRGFIVKQHDYDTFVQKINLIMNENQQDYYQRCLKIIEYASNNLTIENFATKIAKIID